MREPPERPWLRFPGLLSEEHPPEDGVALFNSWLAFLYGLSPEELLECQRDYPAPALWDVLYETVRRVRQIDRTLGGTTTIAILIERLWQSTTLK
jgi:hypothetical protein